METVVKLRKKNKYQTLFGLVFLHVRTFRNLICAGADLVV